MKESQIYLAFIKEQKHILITPALLLALSGGFLQLQKPQMIHQNVLLQMRYVPEDLEEKIHLTDQAVSLIRSVHIQRKLNTNPENKLTVFKTGPVLFQMEVSGENKETVSSDLNSTISFSKESFPLEQVGEKVEFTTKASTLRGILIGLGSGIILGSLISLIRLYFKNF